MDGCRTCELLARRDAGEAPLWDCIVRTPSWDVVHCNATSLTGWVVLCARRHIAALADLTDNEARELGPLIKNVSVALREIVGCEKTYVIQFAEHELHRHVHVHVIPRAPELPVELQGPRVFALLGVPEAELVPEDDMNAFAAQLQRRLSR